MAKSVSPHVDKKKAVPLSKSKGRFVGYPRNVKRTLNVGNVTRRHATGKAQGYASRDIDDIIKDMDKKHRQSGRHHKR